METDQPVRRRRSALPAGRSVGGGATCTGDVPARATEKAAVPRTCERIPLCLCRGRDKDGPANVITVERAGGASPKSLYGHERGNMKRSIVALSLAAVAALSLAGTAQGQGVKAAATAKTTTPKASGTASAAPTTSAP